MGAYNWLRAELNCHRCHQRFPVALQVPVGWCRYEEYSLGDCLVWMDAAMREESRAHSELRTLVEIGSPDWKTFAISAGADSECPYCSARGAAIVVIENNCFQSVSFIPTMVAYGEVVSLEDLSKLEGGLLE